MKLIVSDSTTLIALQRIERFDVLKNLFEQVLIPEKVYNELCHKERAVLRDPFFVTNKITDRLLYKLLSKSLDAGESEAITLAVEMKLPLIIDEKKGRKIAQNMDITVIGLLGILILSTKRKIVSSKEAVAIYVKAKKNNFRVSEQLESQFLEQIALLEEYDA